MNSKSARRQRLALPPPHASRSVFLSGMKEAEKEIVQNLFHEAIVAGATTPSAVICAVRTSAQAVISEHTSDFYPRCVCERLLKRLDMMKAFAMRYASTLLDGGTDR